MISSCDLIMSVSLDALDRVVRVVVELIEHHLVHLIIDRHGLLSREQSLRTLVLLLLKPRMAPDF
jgi:hypothetical protein